MNSALPADPRRIALFLPDLGGGGAERAMTGLAGEFVSRGLDVDLVVGRAVGPNLERVPPGVRLVDLRTVRISRTLWPLVRYLRRVRPDALLSTCNHANVVAAVAGRLAGGETRVVLRQGDTLSETPRWLGTVTARLLVAVARRVYRLADRVIANSDGVAKDLVACIGLPQERVVRIYNHVDIDRVQAAGACPQDHPWLQSGRAPVVVGVGRLTAVKDWPTLVRAFAHLETERPAHLILLGEGEERGAIEALVNELGLVDRVHLPGFVANPHAIMARASLVVLSSRLEGLPNVLIEALALGRPVVSTDCPSGPREILDGGRFGPLVPCGDVDALTAAMRSALDAPLASEVLEARARDFAPDVIIPRYLEVLFGPA